MQSARMFFFHLKFHLFIFIAFGTLFCSKFCSSEAMKYSIGAETCCEARLWPDECLSQIFYDSSRNSLNDYCRLSVKLCCLLNQDHKLCDQLSFRLSSENICNQPDQDHCCVACQIGEKLADRRSDCSANELRKFITKQDAHVLQILMECCKQRKQRREKMEIDGKIRDGRVLRFNRSTNKTEDVDECMIRNNGCYRSQRCVNKYGSYICQPRDVCKNGFRFNKLTLTCDDIDECHERRWACPTGEVCNNLLGSFTCFHPLCPEGYDVNNFKRWSNYNKCVRKFCAIDKEKCEVKPKYLIFKNVTLSTDFIVNKGIALYNIHTKKFKIKPVYSLNVINKISGTKLNQHSFDVVERSTRTVVVLNQALNNPQEFELKIVVSIGKKVIELVTINLSVREN